MKRLALPGCLAAGTVLLVVVVAVMALVGAISAGVTWQANDSRSTNQATSGQAVCTPGETDTAGVTIPEEYQQLVAETAAASGFSEDIIAAQTEQESGWDPNAESHANAQGINQFTEEAWADYGEGGDVWDPADSFPAQGRYLIWLRDFMEPHADDEDHLIELVLAGYNAGPGAVQNHDYDLDKMFESAGYRNETKPYVENIKAAAQGNYTTDCDSTSGEVPEGEIVEAASHLAWDKKVTLPVSSRADHGREAAKPEFVDTSTAINGDIHTAYYTDCGVFVATVMISSGTDPNFPVRGTSIQLDYLRNSNDYEFFTPQSEADLQAGDILILPGHIYIYTGERHSGQDGRAQGASLYTRPPSGHDFYLSDSRGSYNVARFTGA